MECDPELAKSAQEWTDQQAAQGHMHHSKSTNKFTESISWKGWGWEGMDRMEGAIPNAVRSWYSEIKNGYNYQTGRGTGVVGHFKAVVWAGETKLGCGLNIKPNDGTYVTAHYAPPSHPSMENEKIAQDNVQPRGSPGDWKVSALRCISVVEVLCVGYLTLLCILVFFLLFLKMMVISCKLSMWLALVYQRLSMNKTDGEAIFFNINFSEAYLIDSS